ncbi:MULTISPECIES: DUF4357 domain-containing protein [Paracoccus]|jgi:hypothetical protein|uniref:DUF4357 domain-containing protein n=1 Tax=Paracoccus denitrificans (strain Pd 1222) TaxID=318586 RepID=A1B6L7_PARDP|nr:MULTISPECIES: DUF4357 domain-containing protein [Paracoccus]ABL71161.1 conserved hypothetical protein [Paracoccus denitrificans PD1222]MBB4628235.1 hypothetical protein [Paracoccus denitrificans]MCU7429298.1 DUF4357 domain-containing protein [Paracoccus denitrificans]MDK8873286.1 DUF4357 domain-containing protein [Paracoccus sp. SSJ]UPV97517.1 DUF4357 domain-containing protein [Paracoccus denitrificans]
MDEFVDQTKTLVGALGWDLFREMRGRIADLATIAPSVPALSPSPGLLFFFRGAGFAAEMELGASGDFVVLAGSRARVDTAATIPRGTSALRKTLLDSGVLKQEEDFLDFTSDYSFSSASAAAAAICGSSVNGRNSWKLPDGRTLLIGRRTKARYQKH